MNPNSNLVILAPFFRQKSFVQVALGSFLWPLCKNPPQKKKKKNTRWDMIGKKSKKKTKKKQTNEQTIVH